MPSVVAEAYNDAGTVMMSGSAINMQCVAKGTATTYPDTGFGTGSLFDITVTGTAPLIGIRSSSYCGLWQVTRSGSTWTYRLYSFTGPSASIDYYVFDAVQTATSSGVVYEIYAEGGALTFSMEGTKPLRVVDFITPPLWTSPGSATTRTLAAGKDYAVIMTMPTGRHWLHISGEDPFTGRPTDKDVYRYMVDFRVNGANIDLLLHELYHNHGVWVTGDPTDDSDFTFSGGPVMVADVTHF